MNAVLLILIPAFLGVYFTLTQVRHPPLSVGVMLRVMEPVSQWILLFLILLPVAITMSLIWKIKEAILASVFGPDR